jgi:dipeptidyl aminopeptidase/acylaminoacyl peptidase
MRLRPALALLLTVSASAATLEQYLSAPFASELTAAPSGGKIAWILDERGAHNIWVAGAPDFRGRRLTAYTTDDGQQIGQLAWSSDGSVLVYTRGGDLDTFRDIPNPGSRAQWPEQAIFAVPFSGGEPKKLADGSAASVSKDGRVAFLRNGQIWMTSLAGDKPAEAVHTKTSAAQLRWSPDGAALAFVSQRVEHSYLGVFRPSDGSLLYLDPSTDRDSEAAWSPDSRSVAFVRRASERRPGGAGPVREARTPWSIRIADAAAGVGHEVWHADNGRGSAFHPAPQESQLLWTRDGLIIFPWEKTGWQNLYSVPATGGTARDLTPGQFEAEHAVIAANGRDVIFSSNQEDIDRRHVWRVPAAGGAAPARMPGSAGDLEYQPVEPADGTIAFLRAGPKDIGRAAIQTGSASRDLAPETIPADYPAKEQVIPQQVIFSAADGIKIHGQLFLPPGPAGEKRPALVFFHGGSRRQMVLGWHDMEYYSNAYGMNQYLASRGYVVLSVNYRSGIGYGLDFREALNYGATGASEYNDVTGAGLYLAARSDVDPRRIGVWGGSYGGFLVAMALSRSSDLFAAGVDFHGVHDWSVPDLSVANPNLDPRSQTDLIRLAFESSPIASVSTWRSPVLLIHGDDDRNVSFIGTIRLVEALRKNGVEFRELVLPDEVHEFLLHRSWLKSYHATETFFAEKLK